MNFEWRRMTGVASAYRSSRRGESLGQPDLTPKQQSIFWLCWSVLSLLENGYGDVAERWLQAISRCLKEGSELPLAAELQKWVSEELDPRASGVKGASENPGTPGLAAALDAVASALGLSGAALIGAADSQPSLEGVHGTPEEKLSSASSAQGTGRRR